MFGVPEKYTFVWNEIITTHLMQNIVIKCLTSNVNNYFYNLNAMGYCKAEIYHRKSNKNKINDNSRMGFENFQVYNQEIAKI